jgi:DNA-directed RNA polymerase subunit RPC12/RpoP
MKIAIWNYPDIIYNVPIPGTKPYPDLPDELIFDELKCPTCNSQKIYFTGERELTEPPWEHYWCFNCNDRFEIQIQEE